MKLNDFKEELFELEMICILKYYEYNKDDDFINWLNLYYKSLFDTSDYLKIKIFLNFSIFRCNGPIMKIKLNDRFHNILNYIKNNYKLQNISNIKNISYNYSENQIKGMNECCICFYEKNINCFIKFNCNHKFCKECILNTLKEPKNIYSCPICRIVVKSIIFN